MKKVILFDLYDTVLKDISFDFEAGTVWYNVKHLPNTDNICTTEIDDFKKLLELC